MDSAVPLPELTRFDAITQTAAALVYLAIGLAAWLRAPRDARTTVFLAFSLASLAAFGLPALAWFRGMRNPADMPRWIAGSMIAGLAVGSVLLFHFTQVFPRRRPWIRAAGVQLPIAYVLTPIVVAALTFYAPRSVAELSVWYMIAILLFGFPLLVLIGIVLPVAGILSLWKSYREADSAGLRQIKPPVGLMLVSQIAGGVLAIVFAPVLAVVTPNSAAQAALTGVIWVLGLLTPIAFALAVWKYRLLEIDLE